MSFITNQLTGNIVATGSIVPSSNALTLGTAAQGWGNIYIANGNITVVQPNISTIAGLTWDQALTYSVSPTDALTIGQYGITNGISAPYTVVQFTTVPTPPLQIGDLMTGTNIPVGSYVLFVGSGVYNNIVIIGQTVNGNVPSYGTSLTITRSTVDGALAITTQTGTDIQLATGAGGRIVMNGNVYPYNDNIYNVGQRLRRFNSMYLGGNIYMTDQTLGYTNIMNSNNGYFNILGSTGFTVGEFIFSGSNLAIQQSNVDINIGNSNDTGLVQFNRGIAVTNTITGTDTFSVTRQGLVNVLTPKQLLTTESALSIIGSSTGYQQPRTFDGTLLQMTAQCGSPGRVSLDSYGAGNYGLWAARTARGTVCSPSQTMANDNLMRFAGAPWNSNGSFTGQHVYVDLRAAEDITPSNIGTYVAIMATPVGSNVLQTSTMFYGNGIVMGSDGVVPTGITFADSTRQTTAWTGTTSATNITGLATVATSGSYNDLSNTPTISTVGHTGQYGNLLGVPAIVNTLTVGTGLTQTVTSGNVAINATGVANVTAAAGYGGVTVTDLGGKNLVLSLPQPLATNSQVTFGNLTIAGNLVVNGTFTAVQNASVTNKVLNLANNATSGSQIDGGGLVLGQDGFSVSLLYSLVENAWDTDGAGLNTLQLFAENTSVNFLNVATQQHIGLAYAGYDYPSTPLQIDSNFDSYSQIVAVNHSTGTDASTDFVATSNLGNDKTNYIDMGINGGSFSSPTWTINGPNDGYLYVDAGNLAVGTDTPGTNLVFFTGGTLAANAAGYISCGGRWILGSSDDLVTKLQVDGNASFTGNVTATSINVTNVIAAGTVVVGMNLPGAYANANLQILGNQNQSVQVLAQNTNGGSAARTDFVAVANNGSASANYIDMGINSNTYSQAGYTAQYPNDGYLYTSSSNLVISTQTSGKKIVFTTDGINTGNTAGFVTGQRWILGTSDDGHSKLQVAGNIAVTGNIVATQTITAGAMLTTSAGTTGDLTVAGTAHLDGVIASGNVQAISAVVANTLTSNTATTSQTLNVTGSAQVNSLVTNLQATSQTLNVTGAATVNSLQSNGMVVTNGLQSSAQATVANLVSNGTIQGTTAYVTSLQDSGTALVNSLISNGTIQGTTAYVSGLQNSGTSLVNTLVSNVYGVFGQNVTVNSTNVSSSTSTGALVVAGGAGIGGNVYVANAVTAGSVVSWYYTSSTTNGNITIDPNGTGNLLVSGTTPVNILNTATSTSTVNGALTVSGGVGIAGNVYAQSLTLSAGTASQYPLMFTAASALLNPSQAGVVNYDGTVFYSTPMVSQRGIIPSNQYYALKSNRTFVPGNANPANVLGVGVTLSASTRYEFTFYINVSQTAGGISPTLAWGGTATSYITQISYQASTLISAFGTEGNGVDLANLQTSNFGTGVNLTQGGPAGQAGAGVPVSMKLYGMVDVGSTGGTFYPEIGWSGTPGTVTVYALSRMSISPVSLNSGNTSVGLWA